jgi:hypothetical protein
MGSLSDKDMADAKAQAAKLLAPAQASEKADLGASTSGAGSEDGVVEPNGARFVSYHHSGEPEVTEEFKEATDAIKFLTQD